MKQHKGTVRKPDRTDSERNLGTVSRPRTTIKRVKDELQTTEIKGYYTLPDSLVLDDVRLSPEYQQYAMRSRARHSLLAYIRYVFGRRSSEHKVGNVRA